MTTIVTSTRLEAVEHVLVSGSGVLDFAVVDENEYRTWHGVESAEWSFEDVDRVENADEDRVLVYPAGEYFICEIRTSCERENRGPVRCWCE